MVGGVCWVVLLKGGKHIHDVYLFCGNLCEMDGMGLFVFFGVCVRG